MCVCVIASEFLHLHGVVHNEYDVHLPGLGYLNRKYWARLISYLRNCEREEEVRDPSCEITQYVRERRGELWVHFIKQSLRI